MRSMGFAIPPWERSWHGKTHTAWFLPWCMGFVMMHDLSHALPCFTLGKRCRLISWHLLWCCPMKIWCRKSDGRFWAPENSGNRIFGSFSSLNNHFISYSHFFRSHGTYFGMKNCDNLPLNVKCVAEIDKIDQQSIIKLTPCNCWQIYSSLLTYSASQLDWGW